MSMMVSFVLSFFPRDVLDEILNLIESVSEGFPSYSYIQTEANERIRRGLRTKVRAAEQIYQNGDTVFYKRESNERWLGPAGVGF